MNKGKQSQTSNRRNNKKQVLRRQIRHTALKLFAEHGFDEVTVEQIAEAADVSAMTFYRHFGTKQGVVSGMVWNADLRDAIAAALDSENSSDEIEVILASIYSELDEWVEDLSSRVQLIDGSEALLDALWQQTRFWVDDIVEHLESATPLIHRVQARAIVGAILEAILAWPTQDGFPSAESLKTTTRLALETALKTVQP